MSDDSVFAAVGALIGEVGPNGLTFAALARRTGLSAPALAQRFGSKRGLLLAFVANGRGAVTDAFRAAARCDAEPLRSLHAGFAALLSGLRTRDAVANHLAFLQLDLIDPELRVHAVAHSRDLRRQVRLLLDAAVRAGALLPADTRELARACWVAYHGALVTWAVDGTGTLVAWVRRSIDEVLAAHRPA